MVFGLNTGICRKIPYAQNFRKGCMKSMSFSSEVKEELAGKTSTARHCQIAELSAMLSMCGHMEIQKGQAPGLCIQTENEAVSQKCFTLLRKTFNIDTDIVISKNPYLKRGNVYSILVADEEQAARILQTAKLTAQEEGMLNALYLANHMVIQNNCCKRAFIRGAFLVSGSISDPEKFYHFEIVCQTEEKAVQIQEIMQTFHIDAKIVLRKRSYVVYVKEGAQIVELLGLMEANVALMNLENIRILKEMRNSVNRKVNCETANIHKTVNAAVKQIEDIRLIEEKMGLDELSSGLSEIARLRLEFPEATLKELGMMLTPQVGKSGVNHRLRKLSNLAQELRGGKEELL